MCSPGWMQRWSRSMRWIGTASRSPNSSKGWAGWKPHRIATADQRIVLHAKDRGCTAPGCDMPGYLSEVHHVDEWADGGLTNIDGLTFACYGDHKLLRPGGWRTRKLKDGSTQWVPPPHLPLPAGINTYHHPERMLPDD